METQRTAKNVSMKTIILPDGYNGHKVVCHSLPLEKDATTVKLRVYGSSFIKWASLKEYEEACRFEVNMPDLPTIEILDYYADGGNIPAAWINLGGVKGLIESLSVHPEAIGGVDFLEKFISRWENFADQKGWQFKVHPHVSRLTRNDASTGTPKVWIGSHYGDDNALEGHPAAYLVLTPIIENGVSKPVELVLEALDVSFSHIEDPEIVHDMISRWQRYADQKGYGFDYDMELYEYLDERHSWSYTGN